MTMYFVKRTIKPTEKSEKQYTRIFYSGTFGSSITSEASYPIQEFPTTWEVRERGFKSYRKAEEYIEKFTSCSWFEENMKDYDCSFEILYMEV